MRKIANWLEKYTEAETLDLLCDLGCIAAQAANCQEGMTLERLVRKGEFEKVCRYEIPLTLDPFRVAHLRQAVAFFSKLEFLDIGVDKEAAAIEKYLKSEALCRETNECFRAFEEGRFSFRPNVAGVLHDAQRFIQKVLGPRPNLEQLRMRFGPGATSLTKKRESSVKRKLGKGVSCSNELLPWAKALLTQMPQLAQLHATYCGEDEERWMGLVPVVIHEGAISFVRKNAFEDRTTETQPTLNGMLQLAIGDEMFALVSAIPGLDLRDQTRNRNWARIGSLTGCVATLDLISASDCKAVRLVQSLFPEDWFSLLIRARCGVTTLPGGKKVKLEKMSGMGNGFTFPVESLIFYALAKACGERSVPHGTSPVVSVYGDDIIVDTCTVPLLIEVLTSCGFLVNHKKSFVDGPFRESCGADFLSGIDVRPVYTKEVLSPALLFSLHNGLFRRGNTDLASVVHDLVHPSLRLYGPDDYGDGHLLSQDWQSHATRKRGAGPESMGWEGLSFDTFTRTAKRDWAWHPGDRILHTYAVYIRGETPLLDVNLGIPGIDEVAGGREPTPTTCLVDEVVEVIRASGRSRCRFLRAWKTGHGRVVEASTSIPFGDDPETSHGPFELGALEVLRGGDEASPAVSGTGEQISYRRMWQGLAKAPTFPGVDSYKKIAIYTLAG